MTALQVIIKEAKAIRKKNPKMEWKKAVAQASAIYASKHKGKSPVGKKHAVKKKAAKKKVIGKTDKKLQKGLASKGLKMPHGYDVVKRVRKVSGIKRKPTEKTVYKAIKKAASVQKRHMSGIDNISELALKKYVETKAKWDKIKDGIERYKKLPYAERKQYSHELPKARKMMAEYKKHMTELKKYI